MSAIDQLLEPVVGENACGADIADSTEFAELESAVRGKQETALSAAQEPKWNEIEDRCTALLQKSKNLRLAVYLTLAKLRLEQWAGLRDGLQLIHGLLDRYWANVYPLVEDNDPIYRINDLNNLAAPLGTMHDALHVVQRVREIPLIDARSNKLTLADIARSQEGKTDFEGKPVPSLAQVEAIVREVAPDTLRATSGTIAAALAELRSIGDCFRKNASDGQAPNFEALEVVLQSAQRFLASSVGDSTVANGGAADGEVSVESVATGGPAVGGPLRSREQVVRALEQICEYYKRNEQSSPVPLLLRRAQKLATMDFVQIMNELTPSAMDELKKIAGEPPGSPAPPT
jgi:type VI secretion system protein ImpA